MKTIELKNAKKPLAAYAKQVGRHAMVVVKNGKPIAVLSSARGMDAESIAIANSPKFAAIIERSRARQAAEGRHGRAGSAPPTRITTDEEASQEMRV